MAVILRDDGEPLVRGEFTAEGYEKLGGVAGGRRLFDSARFDLEWMLPSLPLADGEARRA